ncbi:MAG: ParA family protein [Eubacteriaceae bacterium]
MKRCKTIAIMNQKGGVGKTTTTFNLGYELLRLGKKVLLVDLDSKANLTMYGGIPNPETLELTLADLMIDVLNNRTINHIEKYIQKSWGLDILPSNIELSKVEFQLMNSMSRKIVLATILEPLKSKYDFILIDCMPSELILSICALATCDSVIVPVKPEFWSAKGLEALLDIINLAKREINPNIFIEGVVITMNNSKLNLTKSILEVIDQVFKERVKIFNTKISKSIIVGESTLRFKPISEFKPNHPIAKDYKALALEVLGQ